MRCVSSTLVMRPAARSAASSRIVLCCLLITLSFHGQGLHRITMLQAALQDWIIQLQLKGVAMAHLADNRLGTTKHGATDRQASLARATLDQVLRRQHARHGAFL